MTKKTVLVLGAGSSVEFGLPAGNKLASEIRQRLHPHTSAQPERLIADRTVWASIHADDFAQLQNGRISGPEYDRRFDALKQALETICRGLGLSRSIDDFLYNHGTNQSVVDIGKMAIVSAILDAERYSSIYALETLSATDRLDKHRDTWLYKLFTHLQTGVRRESANEIFSTLQIINFNYDRCVEHFLACAVEDAYSLTRTEAERIVSNLDIVHPYGQVGWLPWQGRKEHTAPFGATISAEELSGLSAQIKTFTEQNHSDSERAQLRAMIREARVVVFLGFGFHKQNMALISPGRPVNSSGPACFATCYGTSASDQAVFKTLINEGLRDPAYSAPVLTELTCDQFIDEYGLLLWGQR